MQGEVKMKMVCDQGMHLKERFINLVLYGQNYEEMLAIYCKHYMKHCK